MIKEKLESIQALRGVAALAVVLYHGSRFISPYGTGVGDLLFGPAGSIGIVQFFLISGFIMVLVTKNSDAKPLTVYDFIVRRFSRVWPPYAVTMLLFAFFKFGWGYWFDVSNMTALLHSIVLIPSGKGTPPDFGFPVLSVGWSLTYELYFYSVFGVCLILGRWRWIGLLAWFTLSLAIIPSFYAKPSFEVSRVYGFENPFLQIMTSPLNWLFVAGVVIGLIYNSEIKFHNKQVALRVVAFFFLLVFWQYTSRFRIGHGLMNWGVTLVPFTLALVLASKSFEFAVSPMLVYLGDISFSLYLWHPLVQDGLSYPFSMMGWSQFTSGYSYLLLTTVLSIAVASLVKPLLEVWLAGQCRRFLAGASWRQKFRP